MSSPLHSGASSASEAVSASVAEVQVLEQFEQRNAWSTFYRIRYRVRSPGGAWIEQEREFLDRGDAVALLPYCPETGQILLTRQFRMPVFLKRPQEAMLLEVCGGILDDPDPVVTLRHESIEELGLELGTFEKAFEGYSTPGSVCEKVHYFLAPYNSAQRRHLGGGLAHEGEDIEIVEMPLAEALRQIRSGAICDVRTIALVLFLATTGRIPAPTT